ADLAGADELLAAAELLDVDVELRRERLAGGLPGQVAVDEQVGVELLSELPGPLAALDGVGLADGLDVVVADAHHVLERLVGADLVAQRRERAAAERRALGPGSHLAAGVHLAERHDGDVVLAQLAAGLVDAPEGVGEDADDRGGGGHHLAALDVDAAAPAVDARDRPRTDRDGLAVRDVADGDVVATSRAAPGPPGGQPEGHRRPSTVLSACLTRTRSSWRAPASRSPERPRRPRPRG